MALDDESRLRRAGSGAPATWAASVQGARPPSLLCPLDERILEGTLEVLTYNREIHRARHAHLRTRADPLPVCKVYLQILLAIGLRRHLQLILLPADQDLPPDWRSREVRTPIEAQDRAP